MLTFGLFVFLRLTNSATTETRIIFFLSFS